MRIIDKYVLKEMVVPTLAGMLVVVVMMLGNFLYYVISDLIRIQAPAMDVLRLLALKIPTFAWMILPSGALFGCALAVTRLARDTEITMMRMAGISVKRIFMPVFVLGILLSISHYYVQERVVPWSETKSKAVMNRLYHNPTAAPIQANVFFNNGNYWFYTQRVDHKGPNTILNKVMVYEVIPGEPFPTLTTAETAFQRGNVWLLRNGIMRKTDKNGFTSHEAKFKEATLNIRQSLAPMLDGQKTPEEMTASELNKTIKSFASSSKLTADSWKTNYHFKLSIPLSCLLIILCVAPLCLKYGRTGGFMGVLIGILVLAVYWNIIVFGKALGTQGNVPPVVAGWSEVFVFSFAGLILMWKAE